MQNLIFATNNEHKINEIRLQLGTKIPLITLKEAGINIDIPEPHATLAENALEKSKTIAALTGKNCFSEDTGLEVVALNGEPGVKSARYAGEGKSSEYNMDKLLENLAENPNRQAQFKTVISLLLDGREYLFEGTCPGKIALSRAGRKGFGYDPIFIPDGYSQTFAEMTMAEKAAISHRGKAVKQLVDFLQKMG